MAHKHNRRRVRPRVRQHRQAYGTNGLVYDSLCLRPQFTALSESQPVQQCLMKYQAGMPQYMSGITSPYALATISSPSKVARSPKCAISIESERIKMFGGEPGDCEKDNIGLCFKMVEVFEGMDWVNN